MKIGLLCSSPVVYGAMSYLFETGNLAGVAVPSVDTDFVAQLQSYSAQYQFKFSSIDLSDLEYSLSDWLGATTPDLVFVFMFPKRIPASVLSIPRLGFINFHGGKLPEYRSPVPDFWAIRNGEKQGVLTAHIMDSDFDSGSIIAETKVTLTENETSGTFMTKLGSVLSYCMEQTIEELKKGNKGTPQYTEGARYYPRPGDTELLCNFCTMRASEVHALVRAANPRFKGAFTKIGTRPVRLVQTSLFPESGQYQAKAGVIAIDRHKKEVWIGCAGNTSIRIDVVDLFEGIFSGFRFAEYTGLRNGEIV